MFYVEREKMGFRIEFLLLKITCATIKRCYACSTMKRKVRLELENIKLNVAKDFLLWVHQRTDLTAEEKNAATLKKLKEISA